MVGNGLRPELWEKFCERWLCMLIYFIAFSCLPWVFLHFIAVSGLFVAFSYLFLYFLAFLLHFLAVFWLSFLFLACSDFSGLWKVKLLVAICILEKCTFIVYNPKFNLFSSILLHFCSIVISVQVSFLSLFRTRYFLFILNLERIRKTVLRRFCHKLELFL